MFNVLNKLEINDLITAEHFILSCEPLGGHH